MQAKPLAITIVVFAVLAILADAWLAHSTDSILVFDQSQVAAVPSREMLKESLEEITQEQPKTIQKEDSLESTRTVAQGLQDLSLIAQIEKKLFGVKDLRTIDFSVKADNGAIVLSGEVSSARDQQRALRIARNVPGVRSIEDRLQVIEKKPATSVSSSG